MERLSRPSPTSSCGRPSPNPELAASPESVTLEGCLSVPITPEPATASVVKEGSSPRRLYFELLEKDAHSPVRLAVDSPAPDRTEAVDASEASSRPASSPFSTFSYSDDSAQDPAHPTEPMPFLRGSHLTPLDRRSEFSMNGSCLHMMDLVVRQWASLCGLPSVRSVAEVQQTFASRTIAALRLQLWFRQRQAEVMRQAENCAAWTPLPYQDSIPREHTTLFAEQGYDMEQGAQLVKVIIPTTRPGEAFQVDWTPTGSLRKSSCKSFQIQVPEGKQAGDELTLRLPVVPTIDVASKRELSRHLRALGPLKWSRVAPLDVHWSCSEKCVCVRCLREGPSWVCDEMRKLERLERYRWMRGCSMDPSVRTIEEGHSWWNGPQPPYWPNNLDCCAAVLQATFRSLQSASGEPLPEQAFAIFAACLAAPRCW